MQELALSNASGGPLVNIQGSHGSFIIGLDSGAEFEALRGELRRILSATPDVYKGSSARLDIGSRRIALFDIRRLMSLVKEEFGLQITALYCTQRAVLQYAEHELKLRVIAKDEPASPDRVDRSPNAGADIVIETKDPEDTNVDGQAVVDQLGSEAKTVMVNNLSPDELLDDEDGGVALTSALPQEEAVGGRRVLSVDRTLRSGAIVRFPGDVIVFGDVNAGAQIEAAGNILVLGALRGLAHAGAAGDERSVIISFDLRPTQLRIGSKIAMAPDDSVPDMSLRPTGPEIAWVDDDRLVIEPYKDRLPV